jgi:hypothetical protein
MNNSTQHRTEEGLKATTQQPDATMFTFQMLSGARRLPSGAIEEDCVIKSF